MSEQDPYYSKEIIYIGDDEIALHRFCRNPSDTPILLLHGSIESGTIFFTKSGKGLAPFLCREGFDVYIPDMRGKGESLPPVVNGHPHTQSEQIMIDIPAYMDKIASIRSFDRIQFGAHSWGGVLLLSYLARFKDNRVTSMVFFGTKRKIYVKSLRKWYLIDFGWEWMGQRAVKKRGYFPAKDWKYGSENEPAEFYRQVNNWVKRDEWIDELDQFDYHEALQGMNLPPTLYLAGIKDRVLGNPLDVEKLMKETGSHQDAELVLLGKSYGNQVDYGHVDMLTHKAATKDHFPFVARWFRKHK